MLEPVQNESVPLIVGVAGIELIVTGPEFATMQPFGAVTVRLRVTVPDALCLSGSLAVLSARPARGLAGPGFCHEFLSYLRMNVLPEATPGDLLRGLADSNCAPGLPNVHSRSLRTQV